MCLREMNYLKMCFDINNRLNNNYLCGAALEGQGKYAQAREYYRTALEFPDCVFRQRAVERLEATKGL